MRVLPTFKAERRTALRRADQGREPRSPSAGRIECKKVPANTKGIIHRNARLKIREAAAEKRGKNIAFRLDAGKKVC